jgi:hypothetical protein
VGRRSESEMQKRCLPKACGQEERERDAEMTQKVDTMTTTKNGSRMTEENIVTENRNETKARGGRIQAVVWNTPQKKGRQI